jgi:hypothetical protein
LVCLFWLWFLDLPLFLVCSFRSSRFNLFRFVIFCFVPSSYWLFFLLFLTSSAGLCFLPSLVRNADVCRDSGAKGEVKWSQRHSAPIALIKAGRWIRILKIGHTWRIKFGCSGESNVSGQDKWRDWGGVQSLTKGGNTPLVKSRLDQYVSLWDLPKKKRKPNHMNQLDLPY